MARWFSTSSPFSTGAITSFTLSTAFSTPLPPKRCLSPSRSSNASFSPVDAPDGTLARPITPLSSVTSTSTVGFPLESRISRACIFSILIFVFFYLKLIFYFCYPVLYPFVIVLIYVQGQAHKLTVFH